MEANGKMSKKNPFLSAICYSGRHSVLSEVVASPRFLKLKSGSLTHEHLEL